jgi:hypothetical protein
MDFMKEPESWKEVKMLESFWVGHSVFQVPCRVLNYKGRSEALVLSYLYWRANGISFTSNSEVRIEIRVQEKTISARTGVGLWAVSKAIIALEVDGCIGIERRRDPVTNQIRLSVYLLFHSQTKNPLLTTPGVFGVCHQNHEKPYITVPRESRQKLGQMNPAGRQVYLAALALASERVVTSFGIRREHWKAKTLLGRNAFDRGVNECITAGVLSYSRYILTLNDPRTGQPSHRISAERIEHANPAWAYDLKDVTADQWRVVVDRLLPGREFNAGDDGWSSTGRGGTCPFCKSQRSFSVNFITCRYRCYSDTCGDNSRGKLGQLVHRLRRISMAQAKNFIRQCLQEQVAA